VKQQSITPTFGSIVEGIDIGRLAPPVLRRLYELWQQRHVLVLRGLRPDRAAFEAFAAALGDAEPMPSEHGGETCWDAEMSCAERPPFACMVQCVEAPAHGGATWFSCLPAALRSMAPDLAARLHWLAMQHGPSVHPMVIMQPETGESTLYLGARGGSRIEGLPDAESERLLNIVWSYATAASVTLCHRWQAGDVLLWNNLTVTHRHDGVPAGTSRMLQGVRIEGRYTLSAPIQQEAA
jgi:taurine dioxygenase